MKTPYEKSIAAGYSDGEIMEYLSKNEKYSDKITKSREAGYSDDEILNFVKDYNPNKKTLIEKAGRLTGQLALGAAQMTPVGLAIEGTNALSKFLPKSYESSLYRENLRNDIEDWEQAKEMGGFPGRDQPWNEQDDQQLNHLREQLRNPQKAEEFAHEPVPDVGVRSIAENVTGLDLKPEGKLEHAANWLGSFRDPKSFAKLKQSGLNPKEILKAILPSGGNLLGSAGAGFALDEAEKGNWGPIPTMAIAVTSDLLGRGVGKGVKAALSPRQTLAKVAAKFTKPEKLDIQKAIINDFREAGIQADIGTITDNELVKWMQTRAAQSGLTGKPLQDFKEALTKSIKDEYNQIAERLGEAKFSTLHEAGEVGKEYITKLRDQEKKLIGDMYNRARSAITKASEVEATNLASTLKRLEKELAPGAVKSTEQQAVVNILDKLKSDVFDANGFVKKSSVENLMNNKIALNEIINYEVQGGQKQLLKQVVHDIDKAIISHPDKRFVREYSTANKKFAEHAKTFRNDNISRILKSQDPATVMNKMNSIQGMRDIQKALGNTFEGKETFESLKRLKLDEMIGKKMTDNVSQQIKLGTFSNLLKNPKDMQLVKEMLGANAFGKLMKLQKVSGKLAETAQKFYNASQSGTTIIDTAVIAKTLTDMSMVLAGNPWPLLKTATYLGGANYLTKLISDPEFLKLVEEAILASNKNNTSRMLQIGAALEKPIKVALTKQNRTEG